MHLVNRYLQTIYYYVYYTDENVETRGQNTRMIKKVIGVPDKKKFGEPARCHISFVLHSLVDFHIMYNILLCTN